MAAMQTPRPTQEGQVWAASVFFPREGEGKAILGCVGSKGTLGYFLSEQNYQRFFFSYGNLENA